jgi:hypothetical protein
MKKDAKKKGPKRVRASAQPIDRVDRIDPRKELLARVAGNVASALVQAPSPAVTSSDKIAEVAVDIAEQILRRAGVSAPAATVDTPDQAPSCPGSAMPGICTTHGLDPYEDRRDVSGR